MTATEGLRLHPWLPLLRLPDQTLRIYGSETRGAVPAAMAGELLAVARDLSRTGAIPGTGAATRILSGAGALVSRDRVGGAAALGRPVERAFLSRHVRDPDAADRVLCRDDWAVRITGAAPLTQDVERALTDCGLRVSHRSRAHRRTIAVHVGRPNAAAIHEWMASGTPHLVVSPRPASVRVGPLVVPGATACLQCLHLARAQRDRGWPWLCERLSHCPIPHPDPVIGLAAVSLTARMVVGFVEAAQDAMGGCYWVADLDDPVPRRRPVARHPECGCWWPVPSAISSGTPQPTPRSPD